MSGIDHLQEVSLLPAWNSGGSRAAITRLPDRQSVVGRTAYQTLCRLASAEKTTLTIAARARLAIVSDPRAVARPNRMDVLSHARLAVPLTGWSGTPKTLRPKDRQSGHYLNRWEPDRTITQLFIPGPDRLGRDVFQAATSQPI